MALQWQLLERQDHPTLEAIIQVVRVLDQLGIDKPESQIEADKRLEYAARQTATLARREMGDLKVDSFLKKVERLDRNLGTNLGEVFRDWQDPRLKFDDWPKAEIRGRFLHERQTLFNIAEAYQRAIHTHDENPAPIIIAVLTTRLLEERFWPEVIQDFYEVMAGRFRNHVHVELSTIEPYAVLDLATSDYTHNFFVTYSTPGRISEIAKPGCRFKSKLATLHRCFIGHEDLITNLDSPDDVFKRSRLAVHRGSDRILEDFPWDEVNRIAKIRDYRSTTLAIHAYCRSGSGVGVSHVEFLNELEQKELDAVELDPKRYGRSALVCLSPLETIKPESQSEKDKSECVSELERIIHRKFEDIEAKYKTSLRMTKKLSMLQASYTTAMTYLKHGNPADVRVDAWRGAVKLKVTPSLFVHGIAEVFGDSSSQNEKRKLTKKFRLFGRIRFENKSKHGQMVLRAMNSENMEISMASFLVEDSKEGLRCPGLDKPCLVGHWIGKEWGDDFAAPNAGVWIWHHDSNLELKDIADLISDYRDRYPVSILPARLEELLGKDERARKTARKGK